MPPLAVQRPVAAVLFMLLTLGDVLSTELAMRLGMREGNVAAAWVMESYGRDVMYALRLLVASLALLAVIKLTRRFPRVWRSVLVLNWVTGVVVTLNLVQAAFV